MDAMHRALQEWHKVLPPGRILADSEMARYQNNCLNLTRRIVAVIQPEKEAEIVAIVRIAGEFHIPLYTISTGHNWGYGTSLPVADDCAIIDLSRMTVITDLDSELGLVTVEPGVTQQQLSDYLAQHHLNFYVPTTGAGPTASIVGNALEHGFGMTPVEDHFGAVTSIRAVLADGSIYQSAFTEAGAPQAGVWKWGIGPYVDGLFAQGNMGIVTSLQIALSPRAEHTEAFLYSFKNTESLEQMAETCRTLMTDLRGLVGGVKLINRKQLESLVSAEQARKLPKDLTWMGIGVFRCRKCMVGPIRREIRRILQLPFTRLAFINARRNALLRMIFRLVPGKKGAALLRKLAQAEQLLDIMNGIPSAEALRLVYQHTAMSDTRPIDPVRDGVGIIWYAPIVPMKIEMLRRMIQMAEETLKEYDFPALVSFTTVHEKCIMGIVPVIYRRPEEAERAHRCFHALWKRGNALGCPPYRMNVEAMAELTNSPGSTYWSSVAKIKSALDPKNILSPGRYSPTVAQKPQTG